MLNKTAVITGACGQIGTRFTTVLSDMVQEVYALDLNLTNLIERDNIKYIALDITAEDQVLNFFKKLERIDILVNNAGIGVFTPFEERTVSEFKKVVDVNLLGAFLMTQGAIKKMKAQGNGKIVNIGSMYGLISSDPRIYGISGRNNSEVYSATKAGIIQMTKYLACNFARDNIQVNCISPGGVANNQDKDFVKKYEERNPTGRMASEKDLDSALKFLISEESSYVTGQNIVVDGGHTSW